MLNLLYIAGSFLQTALPVVPQPIEQDPGHSAVPTRDGRPFSRSPNFVIGTKGRAFRRLTTRYRTTSRPRLLLSQGPNSTVRNQVLDVTWFSITAGHTGTRPCGRKRSRSIGRL